MREPDFNEHVFGLPDQLAMAAENQTRAHIIGVVAASGHFLRVGLTYLGLIQQEGSFASGRDPSEEAESDILAAARKLYVVSLALQSGKKSQVFDQTAPGIGADVVRLPANQARLLLPSSAFFVASRFNEFEPTLKLNEDAPPIRVEVLQTVGQFQ